MGLSGETNCLLQQDEEEDKDEEELNKVSSDQNEVLGQDFIIGPF